MSNLVKIIWTFIGLNSLALLIFIGAYFVFNEGKNVDSQERGWTLILGLLGLLLILLAAIPLRFSQSTAALIFSGFFAVLPLMIFAGISIEKKFTSLKSKKTFAEFYFKDRIQRGIATAIENNDTVKLKELISGQDLKIKGNKYNLDEEGLTYLQFAIRIRSNPISFPFDNKGNIAAIKILLANGAEPTPALAEGVKYLDEYGVTLLLDAGANPNTHGFIDPSPLIFELIGSEKKDNDMAILLIKKGAKVNAANNDGYTPVMFAAYRAGISANWTDTWRLVRFMLEEAGAEYNYISPEGVSLISIIDKIKKDAKRNNAVMPNDFNKVVAWLDEKLIKT